MIGQYNLFFLATKVALARCGYAEFGMAKGYIESQIFRLTSIFFQGKEICKICASTGLFND